MVSPLFLLLGVYMDMESWPKAYSTDEIEAILSGDRRNIDRILLYALNNITTSFIPHLERETEYFSTLGSAEDIKIRVAWVDAQITKQNVRSKMMLKVAESTTTWALIAFLGFIMYSAWLYTADLLRKTH